MPVHDLMSRREGALPFCNIMITAVSCRLSSVACYNAANTESLLESIVELQSLLLQNSSLLKKSALLSMFESIVATTKEFFATFSARWG